MTVDNHGRTHDPGVARDDVAGASAPKGLDRRQLLGGLVAGAAGLLLPGPGATAQVAAPSSLKRIRFEIFNREWGNNVVLESYWPGPGVNDKTWDKIEVTTLNEGQNTAFESPPDWDDKQVPALRLDADGAGVTAENPLSWPPRVHFLFGSGRSELLDIGESAARQVPGSHRRIRVTRKDDTDDFKMLVVELEAVGKDADIRPGAKQDNDDNDKKDKNKRRRKRGGGGLNDVDQREHPVDRLLD
jgi:hypothetical protein